MWECGLKLRRFELLAVLLRSLPMWECGLKPSSKYKGIVNAAVTPHVGVWIETIIISSDKPLPGSLPMWECGLKQRHRLHLIDRKGHSPCGSVD